MINFQALYKGKIETTVIVFNKFYLHNHIMIPWNVYSTSLPNHFICKPTRKNIMNRSNFCLWSGVDIFVLKFLKRISSGTTFFIIKVFYVINSFAILIV